MLSLQLVNCGLSDATVANLEQRGIAALFPIQKAVFEPVMAGRDLIGRARTGSGKTLAFALPVVESLVKVCPISGLGASFPPEEGHLHSVVRSAADALAERAEA